MLINSAIILLSYVRAFICFTGNEETETSVNLVNDARDYIVKSRVAAAAVAAANDELCVSFFF